MDHPTFLYLIGAFVGILLAVIGVFLKRLLKQLDDRSEQFDIKFDRLLEKFDLLNSTIFEHKADVEVIKEQIHTHARDINSMNNLFDRVRHIESELSGIKVKTGMH